jgi:gluconate 5-dehydrogenase
MLSLDKIPSAVVLGASKGIGFEVSQSLASSGAVEELYMLSRSKKNLTEAAKKIIDTHQTKTKIHLVELDLLDSEACQAWVHQLEDQKVFPRTWIFSAGGDNSGTIHRTPYESMTWEQSESQLTLNLHMPMRLTHLILRDMLRPGSPGHLIYLSSQSGFYARPGLAPYAASKWGLTGFAKSLFEELRETETKVSIVAPGLVDTGLIPNSPEYDRKKFIQAKDVADCVMAALSMSKSCCPLEFHLYTKQNSKN